MFLYLFLFKSVASLRLLFYVPTLSYSHVAFNAQLAEKYVEAGHHVTMIQAVVDESVVYNSSRFEVIRKYVGVSPGEARNLIWTDPGPFEEASPLDPQILWKLIRVSNLFVKICGALMEDSLFLEDMRSRHFDVGLLEQYDSCGFGFFAAVNISRVAWLSATLLFSHQSRVMGVNQPLSYHPELFLPSSQPLTLVQRSQNVLVAWITASLCAYKGWRQSYVFKGRFGFPRSFEFPALLGGEIAGEYLVVGGGAVTPCWFETSLLPLWSNKTSSGKGWSVEVHPTDCPTDLDSLIEKVSSSLVINSTPLFDLPYPISTEFVPVAGVTVFDRARPLDKTWSNRASRAPFVLVSFGSIAQFSEMQHDMKSSFLETFGLFPNITFIVKWQKPPAILPSNVVACDWLPQKSLIAHPHFRAMITHGGWSSILETVMCSRPLLLVPLFADHWRNSRVVAEKGVGIVLDKTSLSTEALSAALFSILHDNRYSARASQISSMLKSSSPSNLLQKTLNSPKRAFVRARDHLDIVPLLVVSLILYVCY